MSTRSPSTSTGMRRKRAELGEPVIAEERHEVVDLVGDALDLEAHQHLAHIGRQVAADDQQRLHTRLMRQPQSSICARAARDVGRRMVPLVRPRQHGVAVDGLDVVGRDAGPAIVGDRHEADLAVVVEPDDVALDRAVEDLRPQRRRRIGIGRLDLDAAQAVGDVGPRMRQPVLRGGRPPQLRDRCRPAPRSGRSTAARPPCRTDGSACTCIRPCPSSRPRGRRAR